MIETPPDIIVRSPWGRYTCTGSAIVWCVSRTLCGAHLWGRPDADETRAIMRLFDTYPRILDSSFDMIIDTRGVEVVDGEALAVLTGWMWKHRAALLERVKLTSVVREAPSGFLLAGLLPTIANNRSFRVTTEPLAAFRDVIGEPGVALALEIEAHAMRLRGVTRELQVIRAMLAKRLDTTIDEAARELGISARSLQRRLGEQRTSFHEEVVTARMTVACELLITTDLKIAAVATRIGISERALGMLFRAKVGLSPVEWRRRNARP
jgi:AraC-like DNA-binding protein